MRVKVREWLKTLEELVNAMRIAVSEDDLRCRPKDGQGNPLRWGQTVADKELERYGEFHIGQTVNICSYLGGPEHAGEATDLAEGSGVILKITQDEDERVKAYIKTGLSHSADGKSWWKIGDLHPISNPPGLRRNRTELGPNSYWSKP